MNWLVFGKWAATIISIILGLFTAGNAASVGVNTMMSGDSTGVVTVAGTGIGSVFFGLLAWLPSLFSKFVPNDGGTAPITTAEIQAMMAAIGALLKNMRDPIAWRNLALAAIDMLDGVVALFPSDNPAVQDFLVWVLEGRSKVIALFAAKEAVQAAFSLPPVPEMAMPPTPVNSVVMGRTPTFAEVMRK
jgi:hypothetical protein